MTMTPWNLPHGQWSKKLTMTMTPSILSMVKLTNFDHLTTVILKFWPWSWSKIFDHLTVTPGRRPNFDHLTTVILKFWPWSWSKIFDHLTVTPGRRPNGQKIVVIFFFFFLWSTDVGLQLARRLSHRVPRGQLLLAAPKDSLERYHKHNNNKYQRNRPRES